MTVSGYFMHRSGIHSRLKPDKTFSINASGEILQPIFQKQPYHPGVASLPDHCYDNPALAEKALDAARAYSKSRPLPLMQSHALPYITRVGSWSE